MITRTKLTLIFCLFLFAASLQFAAGCAGTSQTDRIADAERVLQTVSDTAVIVAKRIDDQNVKDVISAALDEANAAVAEAHRRDVAGEKLDDAYFRDRVWAVINRALKYVDEHTPVSPPK